MRLHDSIESGNGYKARLILKLTGRPFTWVGYDTYAGETRTPEFLALNPVGKIPALELDDGRVLPESNAILWYCAEGTAFLPEDPWDRAQALRWMCFEQYSHEPYVAVARSWQTHFPDDAARMAQLPEKRDRGHEALAIMDGHLARRDWFVGDSYSIADIALYAYTHAAPEGGIELAPYPAVRAWLDRVAAQPGHVSIDWTPQAA